MNRFLLSILIFFTCLEGRASCNSWMDINKDGWHRGPSPVSERQAWLEREGRNAVFALSSPLSFQSDCHGWISGMSRRGGPTEFFPDPAEGRRTVNCQEEGHLQRIDNQCPDPYMGDYNQFGRLVHDRESEVILNFNISIDGDPEHMQYWTMDVIDMNGENLEQGMSCMQNQSFRCFFYDKDFCDRLLAFKDPVGAGQLSDEQRSQIQAIYESKTPAHRQMLERVITEFDEYKIGKPGLRNFTFPEEHTRFPPLPLFPPERAMMNVTTDVHYCQKFSEVGSFTPAVVPTVQDSSANPTVEQE